jgi:hypothetical protein
MLLISFTTLPDLFRRYSQIIDLADDVFGLLYRHR